MRIGRFFGNGLDHVPVFDDLAVLEAIEICNSSSARGGSGPGEDVDRGQIAIDAIGSASSSHAFLSVTKQGISASTSTA